MSDAGQQWMDEWAEMSLEVMAERMIKAGWSEGWAKSPNGAAMALTPIGRQRLAELRTILRELGLESFRQEHWMGLGLHLALQSEPSPNG